MNSTDPSRARQLPAEAAALAQALRLEPLPQEGGLYRQTFADEYSTAIYYLLAGDDFSGLHVLDSVEVYHWYAGAPVRLLLLHPDGTGSEPELGPDVHAGQAPQIVVPDGVWQGSSSAGEWSLIGTTMAPGFRWEGFQLGDQDRLTHQYPAYAGRIAELVHTAPN